MTNEYEQLRLKNLEDNRRILAEIGLINPYKSLPKVSFKKGIRGNKRKTEDNTLSRPAKVHVDLDPEVSGSLRGSHRRSARIQGKDIPSESELQEEVDQWADENEAPVKVTPNRLNFYGAVPGVEIGTIWSTRMECCRDGVHRPTVAGIHGGPDGAYSIALSGGYEDNVDLGDCFTYTGEGGRDLKGTSSNPKNLRTAPQSKDQELVRGNLALSKSVETGNPVRVIRGYKLQQYSPFAPEDGYRYDGLYTVEKYWSTVGRSGFLVWKFALRRCSDQPPPPWTFVETDSQSITSEVTKSKGNSGFDSDEIANQISSSQSSAKNKEMTAEDDKTECDKEIEDENKTECDKEIQDKNKAEFDKEIEDEHKTECDKEIEDKNKTECDKEIQDKNKTECDKEIQDKNKTECDKEIQDKNKTDCDKEIQNENKTECDKEIQDKNNQAIENKIKGQETEMKVDVTETKEDETVNKDQVSVIANESEEMIVLLISE